MDTRIVSGPGRQLAALVGPLRTRGVELRPVLFRRRAWGTHPYADYLDALGIRYHLLTDSGPFDPAPLRQLGQLLRVEKPDIVQTHGYRPSTMVALLSRRSRSWRWIGFHHGTTRENWRVRLYSALDLAVLPFADRVAVVADSQRALLRGAEGKLDVVSNAVLPATGGLFESAGTSYDSEIARYPSPRLGFVGRLSAEKGLDVLLSAFEGLVRGGIAATLVVAGDGPERQSLEALAQDLGIRERVVFLGQVSNVHEVYRSVSVVVLPSRSEGLPNTLLEALADGVPVVATSVGAVPEVLADPMAGMLAAPDDRESLKSAIETVLAGHGTPQHAEARARVASRYSLERRVEEHARIYHLMLAS